jgi:hypothetical protein
MYYKNRVILIGMRVKIIENILSLGIRKEVDKYEEL